MSLQILECVCTSETIFSLDPWGTTGRVCLKSPPNNVVIPPKGCSLLIKSFNEQSTHSTTCWCWEATSYQMIREVCWRSWWCISFFFMLQVLCSWIWMGILNLECDVRPPGRRSEARPVDATQSTILSLAWTATAISLERYVFPQPPPTHLVSFQNGQKCTKIHKKGTEMVLNLVQKTVDCTKEC